MKTYRAIVVVLSVLILWLGYLQLSRPGKLASEPPQDRWHTNTVELWHTNTVSLRPTNMVELWRTNTVVQNFTNEVVKEVAAQLSPAAKQAATAGFKYLNAPLSASSSDALYRVSPIAVEVVMNAFDTSLAAEDADTVRKHVEGILQARSIPIAENSPYRLKLTITPLWRSGVPRVALLTFQLDLKESVALQRQDDVIRCDGIVWSTVGSKLVRTPQMAEELKATLPEQLDKFCKDYLKAKETEPDVKSRMVPVPNDLLPGA